MNEWLKNNSARFKERWGKWSLVQKLILAGIVVAVVIAIVVTVRVNSTPSTAALFNSPVTDQIAQDNIRFRLEQEQVWYDVSSTGYFSVKDESTARRMRSLLISENLVPVGVDVFKEQINLNNWQTTDRERDTAELRRVTNQVKQHIEALADVASADVVITPRKDGLYTADTEPAQASVILTFKPGSDMGTDRKKIRGVQNLILRAVSGLVESNIEIDDTDGNRLNDFEGMAEYDRVAIAGKEIELRKKEEAQLRAQVLSILQQNFGKDRVREVNVSVEMDMSRVSKDQTIYTPVMITEQDPDKPYDTTEKRDYLPVASQTITKEWTGTGYNPEGPAGVEGQNPPVYSDMSNVIGKSTETAVTQNNVMNTEQRHTEVSPMRGKTTVGANIDGYWEKETDGNGNPIFVTEKNIDKLKEMYPNWEDENVIRFKLGRIVRVYKPVSAVQIENAASIVQGSIGYNKNRGDLVHITSFPISHVDEWDVEDISIISSNRRRMMIIISLIGIVVVLIGFIIFRFISREIERKKRLREEELLRQQQMAREKALWDARQEGMEVTMSVEERKRAELQENAIAMAKEHPEDVAQLIRTWLMEDN